MYRTDEPNLTDLVALLRRGIWWALLIGSLAAGLTYFVARGLKPTYEARASLVVSAQDPNQRDFGATLVTAPALDVATYQAAIRSRPLLADALRVLRVLSGPVAGLDSVEDLAEALSVRAEESRISSVIRLSVRSEDAESASALANAVAGAAIRWDEQRATRGIETIIDSLEAQIVSIDFELASATVATQVEGLQRTAADLRLQLSSARALRAGAVGRLELLEAAEPPREAIAPRPARSGAIAGILAFFAVFGLFIIRDALDTRVRGVEELARLTDLPVMAEFPRVSTGRRGIPAEAASHLRTAVGFATSDAHPKVLLVTSGLPANGKSTVSIALAESFARLHYRTLLVDADLRRPVLASVYGVPPTKRTSLRELLDHPTQRVTPARIVFDEKVHFDLVPTFEAVVDPGELLSQRMPALLERLKPDYDVIVIDSAPILPVADSLVIAPHCTGVLLAVSMPDAERRSVSATLDLLRRAGVRVLGTIATNLARTERDSRRYGYASAADGAERTPTVHKPTGDAPTILWGTGPSRDPNALVLSRGRSHLTSGKRK